MKQIRKRGITIVTLVITVIVLAVLTGAVMLTMVGDNGIFGETQTTIDKYNKQAMLEQIKLKIQKKRLAKVNEGQYTLLPLFGFYIHLTQLIVYTIYHVCINLSI